MRALDTADLLYIVMAARWTVLLSLVAFIGGGLGGALIALARTSKRKWLRLASAGYIKVFQGTPLLMQLFLAFFVPGLFGWSVEPWTAAAIGLSLHASAFLGEIWRGSIEDVPRGQWEASTSLGLRYAPTMALVIAPQATRIAIPPTIGFLVELVKGTSLTSIIGFVELTRAAQIVNNATFRAFTIFAVAALVYYAICRPLSAYGRKLEQKLQVGTR
ncbi:amino acid ABC transporter permease [Mesorhizobium sp. M2C.T.Ca.TU.002.02.1.1]|uniref:amino acid ABC transporter permease n=1 Tax=Mesorhizobium sp. M2C.T.Ca.TU.002.02.1.1 TaxID=2496788 RepID=UPI000FCC3F00|nr:amino acid ABC transporter permease [Mesorhizobium sp. M2C.T.Ca.TU.002.02.1.1]RUU57847.1 amino acid ABC transporter permease [Mesorhizobium sp. M2C.T.Ca.TU.002.02.1.1]RUU68860.1 amino acid ABC transporter permease [Mesorhizobium sp. M2C.T.Ca.TU.009.01.2.1]